MYPIGRELHFFSCLPIPFFAFLQTLLHHLHSTESAGRVGVGSTCGTCEGGSIARRRSASSSSSMRSSTSNKLLVQCISHCVNALCCQVYYDDKSGIDTRQKSNQSVSRIVALLLLLLLCIQSYRDIFIHFLQIWRQKKKYRDIFIHLSKIIFFWYRDKFIEIKVAEPWIFYIAKVK